MKLTGKEFHDTFRDWDIPSIKKEINLLEDFVNSEIPSKNKFPDESFHELATKRNKESRELLLKRKKQLELLEKFNDFKNNYKGEQNSLHIFTMLENFI